MIARLRSAWLASRAFARSDPYTPDQFALLREAPAEAKAIRRHRRRRRLLLLKGSGS